jgi:hypothetical protein
MSNFIIGRFVTSILALLIVGSMSHALGQGNALADEDEAAILESLIKLETNHLGAEFSAVRFFSSENIGPLAVLRIAKLGFGLVSAGDIERGKRDHVVDYAVIRSIYLKDGIVTVRVSVVKEGRPCFAPAFSTERSFTYVFQKSANEWVGRLARRSSPFLFSKSVANPTIYPQR